MLTVLATKDEIRATGCTARYKDGEWRVNLPGGTEATAYYTNDGDDAIATARCMARQAGIEALRGTGSSMFVHQPDPR